MASARKTPRCAAQGGGADVRNALYVSVALQRVLGASSFSSLFHILYSAYLPVFLMEGPDNLLSHDSAKKIPYDNFPEQNLTAPIEAQPSGLNMKV